jgi:hypothetical protein
MEGTIGKEIFKLWNRCSVKHNISEISKDDEIYLAENIRKIELAVSFLSF